MRGGGTTLPPLGMSGTRVSVGKWRVRGTDSAVLGVPSVIGDLGVEPGVQRLDHGWVGGGVGEPGSGGQVGEADVDPAVALFELAQARHVGAVDGGWIPVVASAEA